MYRVEPVGEDVTAAIDALPRELQPDFEELRAALEATPRSVGAPYVPSNPTGMRIATFGVQGRGMLLYGVIDRDHVVVQLTVL